MNINLRKVTLLLFVFNIMCFDSCLSAQENKAKQMVTILNSGVAGNTSSNLLKRLQSDVLDQNPDLVIIMVGTNDMLNSKKFVSYEEYQSNLNQIVKSIKNKNSQVLLMSPPRVDSLYLFMRHDQSLFTETPNSKLQRATQIVATVAKENSTLFVDINSAFRAKNLPVHNVDDYVRNEKNSKSKDGVHLKPLGYQFIAENIFQYLKNNKLLNKYKNIVCFGDSLTKGSGAEGAGTITGENYPSFLNKMLNNLK